MFLLLFCKYNHSLPKICNVTRHIIYDTFFMLHTVYVTLGFYFSFGKKYVSFLNLS